MFKRIMAVVLSVILLLTTLLSLIGWVALQRQETQNIMEALRKEAREIAWLASQSRTYSYFDAYGSDMEQALQRDMK